MKTKNVRPILIESREASKLRLDNNGKLTFEPSVIGLHYAGLVHKYQQLILISLDPDEKIEKGNKWIYICPIDGIIYDNNEAIVHNSLPNSWFEKLHDKKNYFKVIATQSQLSPELINQLVSEYNNGGMNDFEIEMEAIPNEFDNPITNPLGLDDFEGSEWETKLTNGFVTVVEKEPILYTKQDMKDAFNAGAAYLLGSYKEFKQIHKPFIEWLNENKKKS